MDPKSINEILDTVRGILKSTPPVARDTSTILPKSIPALPRWSTDLPEGPLPLQRSIERLTTDVLPYLNASSLSARYYGFVTGGVTPAALIADILTSIYDQNVGVHLPSETIATIVEVAALNMLIDLLNLPKQDWEIGAAGNGGGTFTTGATASNVLGLGLGREYVLSEAARRATGKAMSVGEHGILAVAQAAQVDQVKVLSTLPHSSIAKAAALVGLGRSSIVSIAKEGSFLAIDVELLQSLAEDAEAQRTAYILAISAGEVNTGHFASSSIPMVRKVRDICNKHGIWIHVDGAFGLFARILMGHPQAREYAELTDGVQGLELADSITADGHKLLNVPYDCGIFFTRHKHLSVDTCMNGNAAYLSSGTTASLIQSPLNIGIENSRRFRALPVYHSLLAYGRGGYTDMLIRQITLARRFAGWIWEHDKYELLPTSTSKEEAISRTFVIVLFRARDEQVNVQLVQKIKESGKIYVSGTVWDGKPAARIAISNWQVDVEVDGLVTEQVLDSLV
ncbi:hypothetical protein H2198_004544 [Neophaeococcomyces mojaviensis]|uniref:Uncharacterized protein n=1 Tax=Neophaeococcomyces mojaviensis TaxID=3383035 RepID=A0ACC3A8A1_9EURO|nr:hypothetical protein H2198_004544 [Knufia sp. JES_112]